MSHLLIISLLNSPLKEIFKNNEGDAFITHDIYKSCDEIMGPIHVATVKNVLVESNDRKKNWHRNPLTNGGTKRH